MESIIKVDKVIKKFGSDIALSNVSIEFERGKIMGSLEETVPEKLFYLRQ